MTYCGLKSVFEMPTVCSMSCDWAHKYLVVPQSM